MKQNKEIEKILSDLLNAKVSIVWITSTTPNAYTSYSSTNLFRQNKKIPIGVYDSMIWDGKLNSGELMAFILHECGHILSKSIYASIYMPLLFATIDVYLISLTVMLAGEYGMSAATGLLLPATAVIVAFTASPDLINKLLNAIQSFMKKIIPGLYDYIIPYCTYIQHSPMFNTVLKSYQLFIQCVNNITKINKGISNKSIIKYIDNGITNVIKYREEQISDSMAASYGYGPELASGLIKLGNDYSDYFSFECGVADLYNVILISTMDCHPSTHQRILSQIKLLQEDLNNNEMDTRMKKQLIDDLKELEKVESRCAKLSNEERLVITTALHEICSKITGEYDVRAALTRIDKSKVRF